MLFRDLQMERWSVGAWSVLRIGSRWEADWRSLGSGSAVVGKRIGHRSRLSGRQTRGAAPPCRQIKETNCRNVAT